MWWHKEKNNEYSVQKLRKEKRKANIGRTKRNDELINSTGEKEVSVGIVSSAFAYNENDDFKNLFKKK